MKFILRRRQNDCEGGGIVCCIEYLKSLPGVGLLCLSERRYHYIDNFLKDLEAALGEMLLVQVGYQGLALQHSHVCWVGVAVCLSF